MLGHRSNQRTTACGLRPSAVRLGVYAWARHLFVRVFYQLL